MKPIKINLRAHWEWFLTGAGFLLVLVIGWFLVWGVTVVARDLGAALGTPAGVNPGEKFDLEAASKLNLRGLN